jgi:hypothetical protein
MGDLRQCLHPNSAIAIVLLVIVLLAIVLLVIAT